MTRVKSDGITGSNKTNPFDEVTGNSQYEPEVAVDPTTGTVGPLLA